MSLGLLMDERSALLLFAFRFARSQYTSFQVNFLFFSFSFFSSLDNPAS